MKEWWCSGWISGTALRTGLKCTYSYEMIKGDATIKKNVLIVLAYRSLNVECSVVL